jgi:hypothetical protein
VSFASTSSDLSDPRFGHAWRNADESIHATVKLGQADLYFGSAADARAVAAACTEAAEAMDRLADGGQQ